MCIINSVSDMETDQSSSVASGGGDPMESNSNSSEDE